MSKHLVLSYLNLKFKITTHNLILNFKFFFLIVIVEASGAIDIFDEALYVFGFGHYTWKVEVISADF